MDTLMEKTAEIKHQQNPQSGIYLLIFLHSPFLYFKCDGAFMSREPDLTVQGVEV